MVDVIQKLQDGIETMEVHNEDDDLYQSVLKTSQFFTSMVEILPAKFYLSQEEEDSENIFNPKNKKRKKKKPVDKKLLAKKAKLLKLDPSQHKSILELQEEIEKKEKELHRDAANKPSSIQAVNVSEVPSTTSLADLHEKLHAKMDQLRGNRKILTANNGNGKGKNAKSKLEKKKINIDKKKREKESANIKISTAIEKNAIDNNVKNGSGDVVFSKFDFATVEGRNAEAHQAKKKKDLKQLLNIAERKQNKLKLLEETDSQKAEETKKKISWDSALQKAAGTKLKDNPKLLKKTIKRKEKVKQKSKKTWDDRVETVEKQKEEKQKLRRQHIKEKREENANKKSGKKKKKKFSPGF